MPFEFWDIVITPQFLIPFGLVLAFFVPMLYSIRKTYLAGKEENSSDREYD